MRISILFCFVLSGVLNAQTGGEHTFAFLDLGFNARANALGTDFISVQDQDLNLAVANPSLLNKSMHHTIGVNQALLAGGINYGMFNYGHHFEGKGTMSAHLRYVSYGKMDRTDESGINQGTFSAGDFILGAGYGKRLNPNISIGANVNLIYSQLETYSAFGTSIDLAGSYHSTDERTLVTALIKNAGFQFKSYTSKNRAPLPVEAQMAISHKLQHAPFRLSLLAHHLNTWDITYVDPTLKPTTDPLTGEVIPVPVAGFGEKLARHFTYQLELMLGQKLHIRLAFDYHKRQELKLEQRPGVAGFSFGAGLYFNRFSIDYGLNIYSQAGYNNMLTLTTNLDKWKK